MDSAFLPTAGIVADGLEAENIRSQLIIQNIANAHTTKGPDGLPYQRRMAVFESYLNDQVAQSTGDGSLGTSVRVSGIQKDQTPGARIYDPGHPHADAEGMVEQSNVKMHREMVDLMTSQRTSEALLSVFQTSRQLAQKAISIGN